MAIPTQREARIFMQTNKDGEFIDPTIRHGSLVTEWLLPLVAARADGTLLTFGEARQQVVNSLNLGAMAETIMRVVDDALPEESLAFARELIGVAFGEEIS